jgi:hypothetical protein
MIWRRVFEQNGEEYDGGKSHCPGDGKCEIWDASQGRPRDEREMVCGDCKRCSGPPPEEIEDPANDATADDGELEDIVDEIADIILYQDAGSSTDWGVYSPEYLWLAGQWRHAEKTLVALRHLKLIRVMTSHAGT